MTATADLLRAVRDAGGEVTVEGTNLRVRASAPLRSDLMEALRTQKAEVIDLLTGEVDSNSEFEERAAICEFEGQLPRAWADGLARLDTMPPPANVPAKRWETFVNDAARLANDWLPVAGALGWSTLDVFGCDPCKPDARLDAAGFLWLIGGHEVVALGPDTVALRTKTGATQIIRRRAAAAEVLGRVVAWELEGQTNT